MFTGIVECTGIIREIIPFAEGVHMKVQSNVSSALKVDQSVAHDGVCLTVTEIVGDLHSVTLIKESLDRSHFRLVRIGDTLNLERAMSLDGRLDGHLVQGHVDDTITCMGIETTGDSWMVRFSFKDVHAPLLIDKGSVCINGVSLTVIQPTRQDFQVAIIPYTWAHTNLQKLHIGQICNVEFDLYAKYLWRWHNLEHTKNESYI